MWGAEVFPQTFKIRGSQNKMELCNVGNLALKWGKVDGGGCVLRLVETFL